MRLKTLTPQTIISRELYAYRAADRQIRDVIADMGRPGYVLVARQMGKTNLLLNAKRELESEEVLFAYVDLSNKFDDLRDCYRNIIDTAIDANFSKLGLARLDVARIRNAFEETLPPHKEHEQELLALLRNFNGKIVVILDEIDALINVDFSDQLFAQIRSVYFSRANFSEFNRITYILSGVAEPSEIIKNKNVSPFNIGEKIYLDDFSIEEYRGFLAQACLELDQPVADRIYYWASGNPRLTWDICSAIEDEIISGKFIDISVVDSVVNKLYLVSFDRPPIDHIRKLCEESRPVRQAIIEIRNGNFSELTDAIRKRLYLAGIIASSEMSRNIVSIKNRIIDQALSVEWLDDINKTTVGLRRLGDEKFELGLYEEATKLYEEYFENASNVSPITIYRAATAAYTLGQFDKAKVFYERVLSLEDATLDKSLLAATLHFYSMCQLALKEFSASITTLERLVSIDSEFKIFALGNLSGAYSSLDLMRYSDKVIECCQAVIENSGQNRYPASSEVLGSAYWNIAEAFLAKSLTDEAIANYNNSFYSAPISWRPAIFLRLFAMERDSPNLKELLTAISNEIVNNEIDFSDYSVHTKLALEPSTFNGLLLASLFYDNFDNFDFLSTYAVNKLYSGTTKFQLWKRLACDVLDINNSMLLEKLIPIILHGSSSKDSVDLLNASRANVKIHNPVVFSEFDTEYLGRLETGNVTPDIDKLFFYWLASRIAFALNNKKLELADRLLGIAQMYRASTPAEVQVNYVAIDYLSLRAATIARRWKQAEHYADAVIYQCELHSKLEDRVLRQHCFIDRSELEAIVKQARETKDYLPSRLVEPFVRPGKIGANEFVTVRYENGVVARSKFKKVKGDIEAGQCQITEYVRN